MSGWRERSILAFQARADYQNHAIGWLHRGYSSNLAVGKWYEFHEFGWYMGNVGLRLLAKTVCFVDFTIRVGHGRRDHWIS